jgi:hypothetical protein
MLGITTTNARVGGFRGGILAEAKTIYNRIIADGGVSNLTRLNFFVKGLKAIYGDLANVPVCYDAHWIGYKLGSGTGATAGEAVAKLYSLTVAGDAVQATAASQPLLLAHNGASSDNYWWGSGAIGNFVRTPNAAANQIIGTIEYKVTCNNKNWGVTVVPIGKSTNLNVGSSLLFFSSGGVNSLVFIYSINGIAEQYVFSDPHTLSNNVDYVIKYSGIAGGVGSFWYSTDNGVTFTQIGTNKSHPATWFNSTSAVSVGASTSGQNAFQGKIYRATISNSIGGTPVVDFNPATYNASTSQTAWTSATGEVWTINTGTATTGYKGVLVDRTIVQGDGVNDVITSGTIASRQYFTSYSSSRIFPTTGDRPIYSGSSVSHVLYGGLGPITAYNGANLNSLITSYLLNMATVDFNSITSKIRINTGSDVIGSTGALGLTSTTVNLFSYAAATFGNTQLNTLIQPSSLDSDATKTAVYNLIRSLNNNAF